MLRGWRGRGRGCRVVKGRGVVVRSGTICFVVDVAARDAERVVRGEARL